MLYEILLLKAFRPNFAKMRQRTPPKELHYVFSEEASSYPCVSRVVKFRPDVVCPVNPFGGSECGLHLVPLTDGPLLVLSVAVVFILGRSSKRVVVTVNMTILDKIPVRLPEIELVRLDFLWQHAEALFIELQLHGEVGRFVVGVPTEMVDVGVTVHDAGANLRTELDLGLRLAPDNRTEVRLVDADDASLYPPKNNELLIDNNNLQMVV